MDLAFNRSNINSIAADDNELQRTEFPTGGTVKIQEETLEMLEKRRESALIAWIAERHVQSVRVAPNQQFAFPKFEDFVERNSMGEEVRVRWEHWLGHLLLYYSQGFSAQYVDEFVEPTFDVDILRLYAERVIVASAPWQAWLMHVRRVYLWEDPIETGRWFALFVFLWYHSKIMTFVYGYIVYMVVRNYYFPSSVESVRESIARSMDRGATAYKFSELITKHDHDDWVQSVIDYLGPLIQIQIGDMANTLEAMYNFYHWKSPQKTIASLYLFFACFLISATANMEFCMKIFWFIIGVSFFVCWPISSRYPRYRHLVSPIKWVLWDIPTHPEWTLQYLRKEAQMSRETLVREKTKWKHSGEAKYSSESSSGNMRFRPQKRQNGSSNYNPSPDPSSHSENEDEDWQIADSTTTTPDDQATLSFKCECSGTAGRLTISPSTIYFVRSRAPKDELWRRSCADLVGMSKISRLTTDTAKPHKHHHHQSRALDLEFRDGEVVRLGRFKERDRAFNGVIGMLSGVKWVAVDRAGG